MTGEDLNRRIRASRNQPPPNAGVLEDWPDAPFPDQAPIEPRAHAERIGIGFLAACMLPWLPILWWIIRHA